MSMKTKDEVERSWAGADVALERLRCAEGAVRSDCAACPRLSLRDIADPTLRGLRQPRRYENRQNKARMSMKTKDRLLPVIYFASTEPYSRMDRR